MASDNSLPAALQTPSELKTQLDGWWLAWPDPPPAVWPPSSWGQLSVQIWSIGAASGLVAYS